MCWASKRVAAVRSPSTRHASLRRGEAFELEPPQRFERERLAEQLARVVGKHDFTRLGLRLQPRGEIRRLAAGRTLSRRRADADLADDDPASGDADAGLKFGVAVEALRLERLNDAQCRARGARRIVLVRLRIAEVNQHAVAEELRDVARVAVPLLPPPCRDSCG